MLTDNDKCFVCGEKNPDGLKLQFTYSQDGEKVETTFSPDEKYQGWEGVVHGGIIFTLLDEVMAKAAARKGFRVLTGEVTARFKNPAGITEHLRFEGEIASITKKIIYAKGTAYTENGTIVAQATSKMFIT